MEHIVSIFSRKYEHGSLRASRTPPTRINEALHTFAEEVSEAAILLYKSNQSGGANASVQRIRERWAQASDLKYVRVSFQPVADRPLVVVRAVGFFTSLFRHLQIISHQAHITEKYLLNLHII